MVQLELDFTPTLRSETGMEFHKGQILRIFEPGRVRQGEERKFFPISVEEGLSMLEEYSHSYFAQIRDLVDNVDGLIAEAINKALPFLQGKLGNYRSFTQFKWARYETILHIIVANRNRQLAVPVLSNSDHSQLKLVSKKGLSSFQPTLFRFREASELLEDIRVDQLLADLDNPKRVIYNSDSKVIDEREQIFNSWDPEYFARLGEWAKEAVRLWVYDPALSSGDIAEILKDEGYNVTGHAIRMMRMRGKKYSLNNLPKRQFTEV